MFILEILKQFNIDMNDPNLPYLVYLCLNIFVLTFICLLSLMNLIFYFTILLNKDNIYLKKITDFHWVLFKIFNLYLKTSKYFIISEVFLFLMCNIGILYVTLEIINDHYKLY